MPQAIYPVHASVRERAHIQSLEQYQALYRRSLEDPAGFWAEQAHTLDWFHPWHTVLDADYEAVDFGWYLGGRLNACFNCVDRHVEQHGERTAIIWAGDEPGNYRHVSYRELKHEVCRLANVLLAHGVRKGDRVCIYLPMIPETGVRDAGLRAHRRGALGGVRRVLGRVAARPHPRRRLQGGDHRQRGPARRQARSRSRPSPTSAVEGLSMVETVLVARRTDARGADEGRPRLLARRRDEAAARAPARSSGWTPRIPLYILYTSGSTGKPKGVLHTTGGYLVYAAITHKLVFDYHAGDVYCCAADVGWVTGHSYIVYGPLANGATTVMFESMPVYPDAGRYWRMVDDLGINIFYTAPTALRAIAQRGRRAGEALLAQEPARCSARSASRSIPRSGAGTTTWWATAAARWSTPGGRPRPAAS